MKVALIADSFSVKAGTGVARHNQQLLAGLISRGLAVEPIAPQPPALPFGVAINHTLRMPYIVRRKARQFDLIHATSPITALAFPALEKPKVVTYYDLIPLLGRNTSSSFHTRLFARLFLRIGRCADRIIAISSQTKEEIVAHLGIPADKISVVELGISGMFEPQRRGTRDSHVIGYVGSLDRRKTLAYLIEAIHILRTGDPGIAAKLVICGNRSREYARLVRLTTELGLTQVVEFKGSIPDHELVGAYNSFDVFVFPSEWEGFGLPILEAQRCGVPVIIREDAHIPAEVSRCCLKARSAQDMAAKIYELLTNAALRETVIEQALHYSQEFTWERAVGQTLQVYQEAVQEWRER